MMLCNSKEVNKMATQVHAFAKNATKRLWMSNSKSETGMASADHHHHEHRWMKKPD